MYMTFKGYYSYHSNFPHMKLNLHSNMFFKFKWIKSLYIFKIKKIMYQDSKRLMLEKKKKKQVS